MDAITLPALPTLPTSPAAAAEAAAGESTPGPQAAQPGAPAGFERLLEQGLARIAEACGHVATAEGLIGDDAAQDEDHRDADDPPLAIFPFPLPLNDALPPVPLLMALPPAAHRDLPTEAPVDAPRRAIPAVRAGPKTHEPELTPVAGTDDTAPSPPAARAATIAAPGDFLPRSVDTAAAPAAMDSPIHVSVHAPLMLSTPAPEPRSAVAPAPQLHIEVPLGASGWADALGHQVIWLVGQDQHGATLHLTPPDLGPLDISLTVTDDRTSIQFVSPHAAVREVIEAALPTLRESMAQNGIQLGEAMISGHPQAGEHGNARHAGTPASAAARGRESGGPVVLPTVLGTARLHAGLIDTFA